LQNIHNWERSCFELFVSANDFIVLTCILFVSLDQELLNQEISRGDAGINHVTWAVSRIDSERAVAWKKEDEDYVKDLIRKSAAFPHLQKGFLIGFKLSLHAAESGTNYSN